MPMSDLTLGVVGLGVLGQPGRDIIAAWLARGGHVIEGVARDGPHTLRYGEQLFGHDAYVTMFGSGTETEILTGLAATGVQLILAPGDSRHWASQVVVPVVRIGSRSGSLSAQALWDGLVLDRSADGWVDYLIDVANGHPTVGEKIAPGTFALAQCGPTV
jgi:altronate dehydratase